MDRIDDNTPQFHSSRQNALPRSPTPSDNSPQSSLVSQSGTVPKTLQKVPSYAEYTRLALSSKDPHGVPDAASNQPSRSTERSEPRLTDNLTTADSSPASTSHERTSKNKKDMSRSRSGQPPTSVDNVHGVTAPPISSSKSSGMFASKDVPTSSRNAPLTRAPQATGTDPSGLLWEEELGGRNTSQVPQANSTREGNAAKPLAQVVGRTPSVRPSPKPSVHPAPALNQPSVSTSSPPSHVAPTMTKTTSGWMRTPHSKLPNESRGDSHTDGALSELPRPPDKGKRKAHSNERSHTDPLDPSGTPPLPPEHPASAAGSPSRPQPESGPRGLDRSTSRIRGNEGVGREARRAAEGLTSAKGETRPGPILPSKPMQSTGQPYSAAVPLVPQKGTPTRSPPETGDDTSSRLAGDRRRGETHTSSLVQPDPHQEAVENKPHAKPSDQIGHTLSSARAAPPIFQVSSNTGKERGSQSQLGHSISQAQHPRSESSGMVPNQQYRTDPLMARETGLPSSEHAAAIGVPSFPHFRPVIAYIPVHPDEISNPERSPPPPAYQPSLSPAPGVPVAQEGTASRSGARIPSGVHDEPKKLPASLVLEAPRHPNDQSHMDRSGELKQLLLPTRDDAVAAVCPPTSHSQPVEVYRSDRSHLPHGVRQLDALSSPKIWDRSRSRSSVEQDNETSTTLIRDIQHEVGSRRAGGSFDDGRRGRGPRGIPDGGGPPGRIDDDARLSQGSPKPPVPEVVLIPPTRPATPIHKPPGAVPLEHTSIARAHSGPSQRAPTPPEPFRPPRMQPQGPVQPCHPPEKRGLVKKILSIICPCLG